MCTRVNIVRKLGEAIGNKTQSLFYIRHIFLYIRNIILFYSEGNAHYFVKAVSSFD